MRIISAKATNFASYKELAFDFTGQGLTLIQGATGSGKSTLCDVIPWIIFGKTAKGGAVDEVLSFPGDKITEGTVYLDTVTIGRRRGPKAKDNDLMFWPVDGVVTRGKDIPDTQRLINSFLGVDIDLYLAGAYYHEFSQTAQFFTANAKTRRQICEQLVDLSLAKKLQARLSDEYTEFKHKSGGVRDDLEAAKHRFAFLANFSKHQEQKAVQWEQNKASKLSTIEHRMVSFEKVRATEIGRLVAEQNRTSGKCPTCSGPIKHNKIDNSNKIKAEQDRVNPYVEQYQETELEQNPNKDIYANNATEISDLAINIEVLNLKSNILAQSKADNETLQEVVTAYRAAVITNTVQDLEDQTNRLLTNHFDAECKVNFTVADADKLEVIVHKDGNVCSYTQLSKGQRQILKLCFGVSVMAAVANHHGIKFHQVFLDEALDGLDDQMKVKAFKLLETVSQDYDSVFVVEHSSELKERFINKYSVELIDGSSVIEKV